MSSVIDNNEKTMLEALKNSLKQAERIDILTAFFYFSGFNALAEELKDKKIRILVGNTIDPVAITELCRATRVNPDEPLEMYGIRGFARYNNSQKKAAYVDSFIEMFNGSELSSEFDSTENQKIFKMFLKKVEEGSLEIRLTSSTNHAKVYILTNKGEYSCFGDQKGIVLMGSSNFTYNGLLGQGEWNERFSDNQKYEEYENHFEQLWNDAKAIDISVKNGNKDFVKQVKERLWLFAKPEPYKIFARILFEVYASLDQQEIKTPHEITGGKYTNFKYQIDAIKFGIDCINKNNGVIIADVVGLGKSIIAAAIAYNLDMRKTVIIVPPHLVDQWADYQQEFGLRGVKVYSSGKIEEVYNTYADDKDPILYVIDEAHRYRNELSDSYQWLHQLTRSNAENKVILLTATPYNNKPQDLFALIKLFQTPSRSTINSVDNLSARFHELIARYNSLEKEGKRNLSGEIKKELDQVSQSIRRIIDPVVIRRSRLDLQEIEDYAQDLEMQHIQFPEVVGPELVEYNLGSIRISYLHTLTKLSNDFVGARYNPSEYLKDPQAFMEKYGELFGEMNIQLAQRNLAMFIKRLLVMRFESSKAAFKSTIEKILESYDNIKKWWEKGFVPIKKRGYLPDPDENELQETFDEINNISVEGFDIEKIKKKAIPFARDLFREEFIEAVERDADLLRGIYDEWFEGHNVGQDPKYDKISKKITTLLAEKPERKIVIFSSYADTAGYVYEKLKEDGKRVFLYTGISSKTERMTVRRNFDASCKHSEQENDYDIIVATDALSEGFNLNRAGVIINYDIPYNPTRVVQRIGRINRINKKMFDKIYIYNFFPTDIGEENTLIRGISTLKMLLINNIVGSDTRTLTPDETLQGYFKSRYNEANNENSEKSWDVEYRNIYNSIKHNNELQRELEKIPARTRIVRKGRSQECAISFAKRGNNVLFAYANVAASTAEIVAPDKVMGLFKAEIEEMSYESDESLDKKFEILRNEIRKPYPRIKIDKRKSEAINNLEKLKVAAPEEKDYIQDLLEVIKKYDDLSDGELKYLAALQVYQSNAKELIKGVKEKIPVHYIIQIKTKVENIDAQIETIMFTEDLRK